MGTDMKKILLVLLLLSILFVSLSSMVYSQDFFSDEVLDARVIEIVKVEGDVFYKKTSDLYWLPASVGLKFQQGDMIKTGKTEDSYTELLIIETKENGLQGILKLASATQVVVGAYNKDINEVKLDKGELSCIIENQKKNSSFEVRTPTALCGSRGTDFKVSYNPVTTASCFKNSIYLQQLNSQGNPQGDKFTIKQGFKRTAGSGFIGQTQKLSKQEKNKWALWRNNASKTLKNKTSGSGAQGSSGSGKKSLQQNALSMEQEGDEGKKDADDDKKSEQNSQGSEKRRQDTQTSSSNVDSDGDGVLDINDLYPNDPNRASGNDLDGDGIDNEFDADMDGDGFLNCADAFATDYYEQYDSDSDGWGNNEDAFPDDAILDPDSTVKGYGSRHEIRQKIYDLVEEGDIRDDIAQHQKDIYWRDMDARLTQLADAQMHKVMTDKWGNRVRVEQYIMRPADNQVQILDINLRTDDASNQGRHGLSTLSFTTTFNRNIEGDELNELPWQDYLDVFEDSGSYRITSSDETYYQVGSSDPKLAYPTKMEIDLAHNNDSIEETVWFDDRTYSTTWYQDVSETYQFSVNGTSEYTAIDDYYSNVSSTSTGFTLDMSDEHVLVADFYLINNSGGDLENEHVYDDLRDMLSHGLFGLNNGYNLEAVFNCGDVFSQPIDVIISPMKDSNWETNADWTNWTQGEIVAE
jgi:hypothetical protein